MKQFKNILVGVDLSQGDRLVSDELPPPTLEAIERALWLAKLNSARLLFFNAIDISAAAQRMIDESEGEKNSVQEESKSVLLDLVARAAEYGVTADSEVAFGKSWVEIIRRVLIRDHDLVVVGTRHLSATWSVIIGSTGIKLLRKCPCPVWITQPQENKQIESILVAHDLKPVGDLAMELGCSMAKLHDAQLHILHSVEFPEFDNAFEQHVADDKMAFYRSNAKGHIEAQLANCNLTKTPRIHLVTGSADLAVLEHIAKYNIQLLTMGTIARSGIPGFITGNTAERLLPGIPCSVLAVKPADFVSPVTL